MTTLFSIISTGFWIMYQDNSVSYTLAIRYYANDIFYISDALEIHK